MITPGTHVAYYPGDGHRPEDHWLGTVAHHHLNPDGTQGGLTDIECTDPCGFFNQRAGHVTTVETRKLRLVEATAPVGAVEQPTLFDPTP